MSWNKGLGLKMTCTTLRIDPNDGSPVTEYRVEDGRLEHRTIRILAEPGAGDGQWQRLTREQLASLVSANTVVAHWLARRLGIHALVRACSQPSSSASNGTGESRYFGRRIVVGEFSPLIAQGETAS
jgi:hypothetical protein